MSATSGDLLGITNVLMPSGFTVAPVVTPPVRPPRRRQPHITFPGGRRPLPVAVTSRLLFIGAAQPVMALRCDADGMIRFGGFAAAYLRDFAVRVSPKMACVAGVDSALAFEGRAKAITYNEQAVKIVLGLV